MTNSEHPQIGGEEMSRLIINATAIPGASIEGAASDAKEFAGKMKISGVNLTFNGIDIFVSSKSDINKVRDNYFLSKERDAEEKRRIAMELKAQNRKALYDRYDI